MSFLLRRVTLFGLSQSKQKISLCINREFCQRAYVERSINQVTLLGRAGMDPQLRGSNNTVSVFTLATNTTFKQHDQAFKQKTQWHKIAVFKPHLQELINNYLKK
ncbi:single-stranded DNA-binding protein-like protein, partial [Dinothrombium tinctorium]